jgi:hypothetical protein
MRENNLRIADESSIIKISRFQQRQRVKQRRGYLSMTLHVCVISVTFVKDLLRQRLRISFDFD